MKLIGIHSVPRSGSTWLGQIFNSSPSVIYRFQPLFSYAFKDRLDSKSNRHDINLFFKELENTGDEFILQKKYDLGFQKEKLSHLVYKEVRYHNVLENLMKKRSDIKCLFIVRHPLSVLQSWVNAPREFRRDLGWKIEDEWNYAASKNQNKPEEYFGFDGWLRSCKIFQSLQLEYPDRILIVKYDRLLKFTEEYIKEIFDFVDITYTLQTKKFISESKSRHSEDPYNVFKVKFEDRDWNDIPRDIAFNINSILESSDLLNLIY